VNAFVYNWLSVLLICVYGIVVAEPPIQVRRQIQMMRKWISITPPGMKIHWPNAIKLQHVASLTLDHASSGETQRRSVSHTTIDLPQHRPSNSRYSKHVQIAPASTL
jgi:hypothetical protein